MSVVLENGLKHLGTFIYVVHVITLLIAVKSAHAVWHRTEKFTSHNIYICTYVLYTHVHIYITRYKVDDHARATHAARRR